MSNFSDYRLLAKLQRLIDKLPYDRRLLLRNLHICNQYPIYNNSNGSSKHDVMIELMERADGDQKARYLGLGMCKSAWACPRCAPLRIEEYRQRITAIIDHWRERGYAAYMVTFTIPHYIDQTATEVFDNLRNTYKTFVLNHIAHWKKASGWIGTIDTNEVKYSRYYGWHFHKHVLFFVPESYGDTFTSAEFEQNWRAKWHNLCTPLLRHTEGSARNVGLYISKTRILNGDYIAKEMAKTCSSRSTKKRKHSADVFDLLVSDDPRDNDLYLEFCEAIHRRSRIHIGRKLSKGVAFDIKKNTPNENPIISTAVVATFTFDEWRSIIRDERETGIEHRVNILQAAIEDYFNGVFFYCHQHALPFPHSPTGYVTYVYA